MRYAFKPTTDIQLFEMIEIMRAIDFDIPDLVYDQLTRSQRHFQEKEEDTLAVPAVNPIQPKAQAKVEQKFEKPQADPQKDMIDSSKMSRKERKRQGVTFGERV